MASRGSATTPAGRTRSTPPAAARRRAAHALLLSQTTRTARLLQRRTKGPAEPHVKSRSLFSPITRQVENKRQLWAVSGFRVQVWAVFTAGHAKPSTLLPQGGTAFLFLGACTGSAAPAEPPGLRVLVRSPRCTPALWSSPASAEASASWRQQVLDVPQIPAKWGTDLL